MPSSQAQNSTTKETRFFIQRMARIEVVAPDTQQAQALYFWVRPECYGLCKDLKERFERQLDRTNAVLKKHSIVKNSHKSVQRLYYAKRFIERVEENNLLTLLVRREMSMKYAIFVFALWQNIIILFFVNFETVAHSSLLVYTANIPLFIVLVLQILRFAIFAFIFYKFWREEGPYLHEQISKSLNAHKESDLVNALLGQANLS
jgi:hypothetical protein